MFDKEFCKKIGQLLKKADDLHLYYYEANGRMSVDDVPLVLIGGACLPIILSRPSDGINFLCKKADAFVRFCDARRKKQTEDWKIAYGRMNAFNQLLKEVIEKVNNSEECLVDIASKNVVRLEYLI